jgi:hypothetical protein
VKNKTPITPLPLSHLEDTIHPRKNLIFFHFISGGGKLFLGVRLKPLPH